MGSGKTVPSQEQPAKLLRQPVIMSKENHTTGTLGDNNGENISVKLGASSALGVNSLPVHFKVG